ncbi:MAG: class I SAM-dependent methyltransferase [Chitinophagaceae bacterium]|nr:MAG: class I SAM-dependent methyltransferase [Chitinophagaceae bacterium]
MQLQEAIHLIRNNFLRQQEGPAVWADLGCGSGLFTKALSSFLSPGSMIYAVDKHLSLQERHLNGVGIIPVQADFVREELQMEKLDGLLMANSLHYVKDKPVFLEKLKKYMKEEIHFLIVEYDTDIPVPVWVPYPVNFNSLISLFTNAGYHRIQKLGERPSRFRRSDMYAAIIGK